MTTPSENEKPTTVIEEEEALNTDQQEHSEPSLHANEEQNKHNDDTTINTDSPPPPPTANTSEEQKEVTGNNTEDDTRSKRSLNSKVKYSSMSYHRPAYYANNHPYGPTPYYYYPPPHHHSMVPIHEKPTPLMVIPTQPSTTVTDNQTGNSTAVSPQNLPPRLRQVSTNETEINGQPSTTVNSPPPPPPPTTNGRRHRSILPRVSSNYYSSHPPPPLMATPPGVLYPYQPGHIAYNIRTPDELELLAFQQQFMGLLPPSPLIWPPPVTYPHFPPYSMYGPSPYMYTNSSAMDSNNSPLNPDAAEWVPIHTDHDSSSSDNNNNILIDDEINFPPLNNNRTEENSSEQKPSIDSSPSTESATTNDKSTPPPSSSKTDSTSQDDHKHLSSSSKLTTITYSTVILQTPDRNKSTKTTDINHQYSQIPTKQRTQIRVSKEITSRRRQPPANRTNTHNTRNNFSAEVRKQVQSTDDWIEVKSKKTKKFDRATNENSSQKLVSDEPIQKMLSPPSSLSSTGEYTTATCTSEEEEVTENKLVMIVENKTITTTTDYNQVIVDDIHQRLDNNERLLIIMRGCPGSGKSTLAKSLNNGYHGQIFSTDDYFKDMNTNEYSFDLSKLDDAHLYNRRLALDAFKRNISPIIIDNTNTTSWEMKPYVAMGKEAGYDILLIEPQTPWRYKPRELVKRNLHNLPLRRIKEILNRFEHNVTVQSLIDQLKTNLFLPCQLPQQQLISDPNQTDTESIDPILTSKKKSLDIIDDSNIVDDVRLCINDMILFLTSNFYQTSLSIPLSDLSLSPSTPSTPHSLFHRSLSRFSSTGTNQDHSFANEHLLRLPTTSFSRCFENLTPPSSTNSSIIGKKRRKNKNKQQIFLNTNNNNNHHQQLSNNEENNFPQLTYQVYLPDDTSDLMVIDEQEFNSIASEGYTRCNHSSPIPQQQKSTTNKNNELLNILQGSLTTQRSSKSIHHIAIQCSSNDFTQNIHHSDRSLIGHLSSSINVHSPPIPPPPGCVECGVQVDFNENKIDSLENLIEFYSDRLSPDMIIQFYELCNSDIQYTQTHIDEHLQHTPIVSSIPTLRQLSLNALNKWDEQIKSSNPSFDTISIGDLLQDINDEEVFEDFISDDPTNQSSIEFSDPKQMTIPWSLINSLQELYGELPTKSTCTYTSDGLILPLDDELSMNIYQALQRFLGVSNKTSKPVNEKKLTKENKKPSKQQQQQWISPGKNDSNRNSTGPNLQDIMNEELKSISAQKQTQKRQLDFASQHKLKELERHFPTVSSDALYDMFISNESDYELTFACISSMLDENPLISTPSPPPSTPRTPATMSRQPPNEPEVHSFEISRRHARDYALKRKECYNKADHANRHGMAGVASYYINQAREQTHLMKDANRQACESLCRIRMIQFRQTHRLDLHELHADEALQLFRQVEQEFSEGNRRTTLKPIEIITGHGKNSPYGGGSGKIRSVILNYLRQRNYKYSEPNKGAILVQL